jgi:Fe-Mn family superoxide dismutase
MMMTKVRNLVAGEAIDPLQVRAIAIQYARDPLNASLFNHASMAHNNHFFFQGLSTNHLPLEHVKDMRDKITTQFGSLDNFRISFIESAAGMFGPGYTWLVWDPTGRGHMGSFKILNTYAAGTPYGEAGHRRQEQDMATGNLGSMGPYSGSGKKDASIAPGSTRLTPLMCVSTWQHVYLHDYGVAGKREFLNNWWDVLDWYVVANNYKGAMASSGDSSTTTAGAGARRFVRN